MTVSGAYLSSVPSANNVGLFDRDVRASSVTESDDGYASSASFTVPEDGRSGYLSVEADGSSSTDGPFLTLTPRGIGPFSNIRGISYAPQTGHIWVAADGVIEEIDVFLHDPVVVRSITGLSYPRISRVTQDGRLLYVDGINGTSTVYQIDVVTGATSVYAHLQDDDFTWPLNPVGIAADPDGSACYIAHYDPNNRLFNDAVARIPAQNGSPIKFPYGGTTFLLSSNCGIEVGLDHAVYLADEDFIRGHVIARLPNADNAYFFCNTDQLASSLEVDRNASTPAMACVFWSPSAGACTAYNKSPIETPGGTTPPRYLGAWIFNYVLPSATGSGLQNLAVEPIWHFSYPYLVSHPPQRIILNNAGQNVPYPSIDQIADRIVALRVSGWPGMRVRLKLMDPPDEAPYAPDGGWGAKGGQTPSAPYDVKDNDVWTEKAQTGYSDFGLSNWASGTNPQMTIDVHIGEDGTGMGYLKLPERFAGDNWRVAVTPLDPDNQPIPNILPAFSPRYTGWKRIYVERDHMFRRGNLLDADVSAPPDGQLYLARWDAATPHSDLMYVQPGDQIVVFDTDHPYPGPGQFPYETATILENPAPAFFEAPKPGGGTKSVLRVYLDHSLGQTYTPSQMDFASGKSAAVGVIQSKDGKIVDTSPNQINGPGSAFYDADMRDIQQPFNDAFVEFIAPMDGVGAVPYLSSELLSLADYDAGCNPAPNTGRIQTVSRFGWIWFGAKGSLPNYLHLIGTACPPVVACLSAYEYCGTTPFSNLGPATHLSLVSACVYTHTEPSSLKEIVQDASCHELGHQFWVNQCVWNDSGHDTYDAWCGDCGGSGVEKCLMNESRDGKNGIVKFGVIPLVGPRPECLANKDAAIRTHVDPLP